MNTFCSYFNSGRCKSCDLIELDHQAQMTLKESKLLASLSPFFTGSLEPSHTSASQGFRHKMKLVVTGSVDQPVLGLWGEETPDEGREILRCPIHHPLLNELAHKIKNFITTSRLIPYSIFERKGELKGIIAFVTPETQEMYLRFVMRSEEAVTRIQKYLPSLLSDFSPLKVVSINIQPVPHAILEGEKEIYLTNAISLHHTLNHVEMLIKPQGFVQTNQQVATALYQDAAAWVKECGIKKFSELFCGQGAFSFAVSPVVEAGLGIEINKDAVEAANKTAERNDLSHLQFQQADSATVNAELMKFQPQLILVNPPRRGLTETVDLLKQIAPEFIIYSSCNHESLGKDLGQLTGYEVRKVKLFDMFPHSRHFETLVLLQRL